MEKINTIDHNKEDLKDLESFLRKNELIDDDNIWFAGFPYLEGAQQNAITGNLFYGNKRLKVVCVKDGNAYYLSNDKQQFIVYMLIKAGESPIISVKRNIMYPSIKIETSHNDKISLQINKNKTKVAEFKKYFK